MTRARLLLTIVTIVQVLGLQAIASRAVAATRLYTGSIRIVVSRGVDDAYSMPFGGNIGYPRMNNLPAGDLAQLGSKAPGAIGLASNQMVLQTSLDLDSPPPSSWNPSSWSPYSLYSIRTSFSAGHQPGSFFESGAPGAAASAPVSSLPLGQFGAEFKGAAARFGGTMALLGQRRSVLHSYYPGSPAYPSGLPHVFCSYCSVWREPLTAVGGSFGGARSMTTWINGTGSSPQFFGVTVWGFPWTTGTVTARAPNFTGHVNNLVYRGSDQRTAYGAGNIQLVTPFVIRRTRSESFFPAARPEQITYRAGVAIANLQFVPEPGRGLMLAGGLSALGGLRILAKRRNRR
jgi:hypothetical protein